ncbi:MAG: type II secretion system protein M [Azoarcus sp.]|jgi:general secretion pathway protein M|nr:type II secretion system protein M [Azoarcus sp.]
MNRKLFSLHTPRARASFAVGFCVVLVLAPCLFVLTYLVHKTLWAKEAIDAGEPRLARLLGLREAATQIGAARATAENSLARFAYPPSTAADRIGAELQQRLRAAADSAEVTVSGSQVIHTREENGLEYIPVTVNFEATHAKVQLFLQALGEQTPVIYIDSLIIVPVRNYAQLDRLQVQGRFSVLRRIP